jgi:hypothetical protein
MKDNATQMVDQKGQADADAFTVTLEPEKSADNQPDSTKSPRGESLEIEDTRFPSQTTDGGRVHQICGRSRVYQIWSQLTLAEISGSSQMRGELQWSKQRTTRRRLERRAVF